MIWVPTKTCTECGETKEVDAFYRSGRSHDGRCHVCSECRPRKTLLKPDRGPTKVCTKCLVEKSLSDFYRMSGVAHRVSSHCKACKVRYACESQKRRQSPLNAKRRERYASDQGFRDLQRRILNQWRSRNKGKVVEQRRRAQASINARKNSGDEKTLRMLQERYRRNYSNPSSRAKRINAALDYAKKHPDRVRGWRNKSARESRMLLKDSYIRKVLRQEGVAVSTETIAIKREQLQLERSRRNLKKVTDQLKQEIKNV